MQLCFFVHVTGAAGRFSDCWGDRCAWESSGVTTSNRSYTLGFWSRVSLHPTSEAPRLGWLVHVAYLVLWAVQRLLPEGSCCYKDRLAIVSNCSMLVIITSSPPRTLCICIHPSVCLSVCLCLWVTLFKTLWISFYDITGGTGLGTRNN